MNIYQYETLVDILRSKIKANSETRGYLSRLAEAAKCHSSHISNVIAERARLSADQALAIGEYWDLSELEIDYFITLLEYERASSRRLKEKMRARLKLIRGRERRIDLTLAHATLYCRNWYFAVVHNLLQIKSLRTVEALSRHLYLTREKIEEVLGRLVEMDLIRFDEDNQEWVSKNSVDFSQSPGLQELMTGAQRIYAAHRRELHLHDGLFETQIATIRKSDLPQLKAKVRELMRDITSPSNATSTEEEPIAIMFGCDLFEI